MISAVLFDLDPSDARTDSLYAVLSDAERMRADQFRFHCDRTRFISRRGQLRWYLSAFAEKDAKDLHIDPDSNGKLVLHDRPDICFNLSKSHGVALCVVSDDCEVGCDIERCDPALARQDVAARFFAPAELQALQTLAGQDWIDGFFRCWTCKEAFVKGTGLGLSYPLQSFSVTVLPGVSAGFTAGGRGWALQALKPFAGFYAAVASATLQAPITSPVPFFRTQGQCH